MSIIPDNEQKMVEKHLTELLEHFDSVESRQRHDGNQAHTASLKPAVETFTPNSVKSANGWIFRNSTNATGPSKKTPNNHEQIAFE